MKNNNIEPNRYTPPIYEFHPLAPFDDADALKHPNHVQYGTAPIPTVPKRETGSETTSPTGNGTSDDSAGGTKGIILVGSGESSGKTANSNSLASLGSSGNTEFSEIDDSSTDPRSGTGQARNFNEGIALIRRRRAAQTGHITRR